MQAIILAAGMGNRLGKYTKENTKCMLEINGKTLIERSFAILETIGIRKVVMVVGYKRDNLIDFLKGRFQNIEIVYTVNPVFDKTNNIYSLYLAKDHLLRDDTLLLESDLIYDQAILERLLADHRENLAVVDKYQSWMDGTVVKLDEQDNIATFIPKKFFDYTEKEKYYKTVNIYKFSRDFSASTYVPFLEAYSSALGKNEYYEQVLRVIATLERNDLKALRLNGEKWYEIDDVQDKDNAETIFSTDDDLKLRRVQKRYGGYWRYPYLKDFCYLVNPYFPTQRMENEITAYFHDLVSQYPSGQSIQNLCAGKVFNLEPDSILVGNGATELIRGLAVAVPGSFGHMFPSFNEYTESIGTNRIVQSFADETDLSYSKEKLLDLSGRCDNLLLINPDNPSGHFLGMQDVLAIAADLHRAGKIFIVDESFADFSSGGAENTLLNQATLEKYPNMVVIKSISKSYGVPGIRLGVMATANGGILEAVRKYLPIWNINSLAEFFLQIVGKHLVSYRSACAAIAAERSRFFEDLRQFEFFNVLPSQANYFLCRVGQGITATGLTRELLGKYNIFIKDLTGKKGLTHGEYVRIAVRNREDNQYLINCLKDMTLNKAGENERNLRQ